MKFTINREHFLPNLQQIVSVIEKRQTMPILSNVLIVVDDGKLILTGTDLEIQIIAKLDLPDSENGEITVPARKLFDLCKLLPANAEIRIEASDDEKVKLISGRSRYSLSTLPADNYPQFSESEMPHRFVITAKNLKRALSKVMFCMANNDVRYYLNGMLLNVTNSKLKFIASDGHRLAMFHDELNEETGLEERLILPRKAVAELFKLLDESEEALTIEFSENNVRVLIKNLVFPQN
jgi:DNA polymerase III subunit beta